jgi:hypothetical protein
MSKKDKPGDTTIRYIEHEKKYWGWEFADILGVEYREEYDDIAGMGACTMLYKIADKFEDGKYRKEILKLYGVDV